MTTCHLCAHDLSEAPVVGTRARAGGRSRRVTCPRCGLVQVCPAPSPEELTAYYASGQFWADHQHSALVVNTASGDERVLLRDDPEYARVDAQRFELRAQAIVRDLGLTPGARVLEVGCGNGRTLAALQALGMEVCGIEPDAGEAKAAAQQLGTVHADGGPIGVVWQTTLDGYNATRDFDAVIGLHVLEHFHDPLEALSHMRALLKPGGKLWLEVPNVEVPSTPLDEHWLWSHMFDFSPHTLRDLLLRAGLDEVHAGSHGNLPSRPGRLLRAWATERGSRPREYADHGGPDGDAMATFFRQIEAAEEDPSITVSVPTRAVLPRFMRGARLSDDQQEQLRGELASVQRGIVRMGEAYSAAADMIGSLGEQYLAESCRLWESWDADPYTHGTLIGQARAFGVVKETLALAANAMRAAELADRAKEGEG